MDEKKHFMTFKEFLESKKKEDTKNIKPLEDWDERRKKWVESIDKLYEVVDNIIISNLKAAGYTVTATKEDIRISEEYVGAYNTQNYIINADHINIKFNPIGTIIIGAYGRVNMLLPKETIKLVLAGWGHWKIVSGIGGSIKLVDFNEQNIIKIFQANL